MLMNRICIALRGLLSLKTVLSVIKLRAATAVLSWKEMKFWMLWKMDFPRNESVLSLMKEAKQVYLLLLLLE
jgi:hypothetical protein